MAVLVLTILVCCAFNKASGSACCRRSSDGYVYDDSDPVCLSDEDICKLQDS